MKKNIYFMRHGETDWNRENRLQGQRDIPLNETGIQQAVDCGRRLDAAGMKFDTIVSSSLDRAVMTAICATGCRREDILIDDRLLEIGYGDYEGATFAELKDDMFAFFRDPDHVPPPETVESIQALMQRTGSFLQDISSLPGENILAVTHGVAIRAVLGHLSGQSDRAVWGMPVENCELYKTVWEDGCFSPVELYRPE